LDVGPLTKTDKHTGQKKAELGLSIYYHWRVEGSKSLLFGNSSGVRKIDNGISTLSGHTILEISLVGRLPEHYVKLSGNKWVCSFTSWQGQPEWAVNLSDGSWFQVERGRLFRGRSDVKKRKTRAK